MRMRRLLGAVLVGATALVPVLSAHPAVATSGLEKVRTVTSLTGTHEWYHQTYKGHRVLGGYYARHLDEAGRVVDVDDGRLEVKGKLRAAKVGKDKAKAKAKGRALKTRLVVLPGEARLAYAVYDAEGYETLVDAGSGKVVKRRSIIKDVTGTGQVFDPNPVTTLRNEGLTDRDDANYAALRRAYVLRKLTHLDGSGFLIGDFADVKGTTGRAESATNDFIYNRTDERFEQVMVYYDVTRTQSYIQSLGFDNINNEPQRMKVNQLGIDNSFYHPVPDYIKLGKGGVDDAEDAEVTWHEYGHAIQDDQVEGFGVGHDGGAIGEAFSDYWAVTMSQPVSDGYEVPCVANWDAVSYTDDAPHCLRRTDLDLTVADQIGAIHFDGQIWSRALWDINRALGRTRANTLILEAQFSFAPDTSFAAAARDTVRAARALYGDAAAAVANDAFADRGIL